MNAFSQQKVHLWTHSTKLEQNVTYTERYIAQGGYFITVILIHFLGGLSLHLNHLIA